MKMNRKQRARDESSGSGIFFSSSRKSKASVSGRGEGEDERQAGVRCLCFWGAFPAPPQEQSCPLLPVGPSLAVPEARPKRQCDTISGRVLTFGLVWPGNSLSLY